jgi:hypothetical protein
MESFPKKGMTYKQSIPKAKRFKKEGSPRLVESVTNQVRIHEGEKAADEFKNEIIRHRSSGKKYFFMS